MSLLDRDLAATSPEAVLARGFAVVRRARGGDAIRDARLLSGGDALDIRFSRGAASAEVVEVKP